MHSAKSLIPKWFPRLLALALVVLAIPYSAALGATSDEIDSARRSFPGGAHPPAALDALMAGDAAWKAHDGASALRLWLRSAELDPDFLAPRLELARIYLVSDPARYAGTVREMLDILGRDFRAQRWLAANTAMEIAVSVAIAVLLLFLGLMARHLRALHHAIAEGLSFLLHSKKPADLLAWTVLALPLLANMGALVTGCFWVFLASFRFSRGERILALSAGAATILLAPFLWVTRPFWAEDPRGRDAAGIYELQQAPSLPPARDAIASWLAVSPNAGPACYLEGLARLSSGEAATAGDWYLRAAQDRDVPPRVLETNTGNALLAAGKRKDALLRYHRAIELDPKAFEPHYNLALASAAQGEYLQADRELDRASRLNLDRLRALGRDRAEHQDLRPLDALWNTNELWAWAIGRPSSAPAPAALLALAPMRSLAWTSPLALLAMMLGVLAGRSLRRLIHVHVCYQCGTPVCRRCLVRLDRRAYCMGCAESLGGQSTEETTRLLLRRLLDERPAWSSRLLPWLAVLLPGIGPVRYGQAGFAAVTSLLTGVGLGLIWYPHWGQGLVSSHFVDPATTWLRGVGIALLILASLTSLFGYHLGRRREHSLRGFLSRDVDRLAA